MVEILRTKGNIKLIPLGTVFGMWTVGDVVAKNQRGELVYAATCSCGNTSNLSGTVLRTRRSLKCRACADKKAGEIRGLKKHIGEGVAVFNSVYSTYRDHSKNRGQSFNISREDFLHITQQNCFYCGSAPSNKFSRKGSGTFVYNGIDRYNNTLGYSVDNCVPCCKKCNIIKLTWVESELMEHLELMLTLYKERCSGKEKPTFSSA